MEQRGQNEAQWRNAGLSQWGEWNWRWGGGLPGRKKLHSLTARDPGTGAELPWSPFPVLRNGNDSLPLQLGRWVPVSCSGWQAQTSC